MSATVSIVVVGLSRLLPPPNAGASVMIIAYCADHACLLSAAAVL